jgi:hypothetical protein
MWNNTRRFLRIAVAALGVLAAGSVTVAGGLFAISEAIKIVELVSSEKYSAFIVLVRVLEVVAITLAAAAFGMDILVTLVSQVWSRDTSSREVVTLLQQLEHEAISILIPTVAVYSALKVLEFAAQPSWPANRDGWVEPIAFAGLILLSLLIQSVMGRPTENAHAHAASHPIHLDPPRSE